MTPPTCSLDTAPARFAAWLAPFGLVPACVLYNDLDQVLIGRTRPWDQILVIEFPETNAFVDMIRDRDYQASLVHRDRSPGRGGGPRSRSLLLI